MSRYLITGAAGFIGSHLTDALLDDGHEVIAIDNLASGYADNLPLGHNRLTYVVADVTEGIPVSTPIDVVCHLASIASPDAYQERPIDTLTVGATGTKHTLEYARRYNARHLFTSTSEVYGDPAVHPQPESYNGDVDTYGPRSCYDESKRYGESLCRAYREQYGVDVAVARLFNSYGPRMRDERAIPTFVRQALAGEPITVHGDGSQTRSFCYVTDTVRGLRRLIDSDLTTPVNIGTTDEQHILDVATQIRDAVGSESEIRFEERPEDDPDIRRPDISKAEHELGWSPSVSFEDGIEETIRWYTG